MALAQRAYELKHIVTFEETNLFGNVYYVNLIAWQGRCRELFLRDHVKDLVRAMDDGLVLATQRCSCEFFGELTAFDEVIIRMMLRDLAQTSLSLAFEYTRMGSDGPSLVAIGEQRITCLHRTGRVVVPCAVPAAIVAALGPYGADAAQRGAA